MKMTGSGLLARTAALTASSMRLDSLCFSRYSWTDMAGALARRNERTHAQQKRGVCVAGPRGRLRGGGADLWGARTICGQLGGLQTSALGRCQAADAGRWLALVAPPRSSARCLRPPSLPLSRRPPPTSRPPSAPLVVVRVVLRLSPAVVVVVVVLVRSHFEHKPGFEGKFYLVCYLLLITFFPHDIL